MKDLLYLLQISYFLYIFSELEMDLTVTATFALLTHIYSILILILWFFSNVRKKNRETKYMNMYKGKKIQESDLSRKSKPRKKGERVRNKSR